MRCLPTSVPEVFLRTFDEPTSFGRVWTACPEVHTDLRFGDDTNAMIALPGAVAGRVASVPPVANA